MKNYNYYFMYKNGNLKIDFSKRDKYLRYSKKRNRKIGNNFEMNKKQFKYNHLENIFNGRFKNQLYIYSDGSIINKSILNKSINKRLRKYIL